MLSTFTPAFSASARGIASRDSAYFLMAYCSSPGQVCVSERERGGRKDEGGSTGISLSLPHPGCHYIHTQLNHKRRSFIRTNSSDNTATHPRNPITGRHLNYAQLYTTPLIQLQEHIHMHSRSPLTGDYIKHVHWRSYLSVAGELLCQLNLSGPRSWHDAPVLGQSLEGVNAVVNGSL